MARPIGRRSRRLFHVPGGFILGMWVACSATAQDVLRDELNACNAIPDSQERLSCFEALADEPRPDTPVAATPPREEPREEEATEPARSSAQLATPATQPGNAGAGSDDAGFGLEHRQPKAPDSKPETQQLTVSEARHNDFTGWTIAFENGQIWRQIGTDRYDIQVGETYSIQRASFNSFLLGNNRNNRKMRVSRVE